MEEVGCEEMSISDCRYEFSNKGGDLFIESLARLNHYLKTTQNPSHMGITVVAFIIYPGMQCSFFN